MRVWKQQHYNTLAKMVRERFPIDSPEDDSHGRDLNNTARVVLALLALDAARRFKKDNPDFDQLKWLDQCSPESTLYPLSGLWEDFMVRADGSKD